MVRINTGSLFWRLCSACSKAKKGGGGRGANKRFSLTNTNLLGHNRIETRVSQMLLPQRDKNSVTWNAWLPEIVSGLLRCYTQLSKHLLTADQRLSSTDSILHELHFLNYRKDGTAIGA